MVSSCVITMSLVPSRKDVVEFLNPFTGHKNFVKLTGWYYMYNGLEYTRFTVIFSEPSLISNRLEMTKLVVLMSRGRRDTDSGSVAFINRSTRSEVKLSPRP